MKSNSKNYAAASYHIMNKMKSSNLLAVKVDY